MRKIIVYFTIICFLGTCLGIPALANVDFSDSEFVDFQNPLAFRIEGHSDPFWFDATEDIANSRSFEPLPPSEADLASSGAVVINEEIKNLVIELNYDLEKIFDYVYNNFPTEFYYGVRSKAVHANIASPWEQCVLLVALLRAAGHHARFVEGIMVKTGEEMMSWTDGPENSYAAGLMLGKRYIPIDPDENFEIFSIKQPGVMVYNMYGLFEWTILDPSDKDYERVAGAELNIESGEKMDALVASANNQEEEGSILIDFDLIKGALREQTDAFDDNVGDLTPEEFFGSSETIQNPTEEKRGVDLSRWLAVKEYSSLPEKFIAKMKIVLSGGDFYQCPISDLAGKELSILPEKFIAKMKIVLSGGDFYQCPISDLAGKELSIACIPDEEGYLPVLKLGEEIVATGDPALSETQIGIGFFEPGKDWEYENVKLPVGHKDVHVLTPNTKNDIKKLREQSQELKSLADLYQEQELELEQEQKQVQTMIDQANYRITELTAESRRYHYLALTDIFFVGIFIYKMLEARDSAEEERKNVTELEGLLIALDQDRETLNLDNLKPRTLGLAGKMYFFLERKNVDDFSKMVGISNVSGISLALTSWTEGGVEMNIVRDVSMPVSLQETQDDDKGAEIKSWLMTKAMLGSAFEGMVLEKLFKTKTYSTASSFVEAAIQEIKIVLLENPEEDLERFSASDKVKNSISIYLRQGFAVAILERPISGQAWIVIGENSVAFQMKGCDGIINGGATGPIEYSPSKAWFIGVAGLEFCDALVVSGSMVLAGGVKIGAGYQVMIASHSAVGAVGLITLGIGTGGVVVGTVFICTAVVVSYKLLSNVCHIIDEHIFNDTNNNDFNDDDVSFLEDLWDYYLNHWKETPDGNVIIGELRIVDDYVYGGDPNGDLDDEDNWSFDDEDNWSFDDEDNWSFDDEDNWSFDDGGDWGLDNEDNWSFDDGGDWGLDYYYDIGIEDDPGYF